MRRARPVLLLAGALLLLVSLYLPLQQLTCGSSCHSGPGLLTPLLDVDGWSTEAGSCAALVALVLIGASCVELLRPVLAGRLATRRCAVIAGYLAFATGVEARSGAHLQASRLAGTHPQYAYGAYVGGTALVVLAAVAGRRRVGSRAFFVRAVPAVTLLVALLLPWQTEEASQITRLGVQAPAGVIAAVLTLLAAAAPERSDRLLLAAGAVLFTLAAFSSLAFLGSYRYGAWLGIAAAGAMLAVAVIEARPLSRPVESSRLAWGASGAAALVVTALFLPWQDECFATSSGFGSYSGRCVTTNAWTSLPGVTAGLLASGLVIVALAARRFAAPVVASALGVALLIATVGFDVVVLKTKDVRAGYGYGSRVGFGAAALLVIVTLVRVRPRVVDWRRIRNRLPPLLACVGYLAVALLPGWNVLPDGLLNALRFAPFSWLTVAGVVSAVWLMCIWAEGAGDLPPRGGLVVLLPAGLVALAVLDLVRVRNAGITWGRGVIPALALVLLLLGWIEERGGLENFEVPEILRVDRL